MLQLALVVYANIYPNMRELLHLSFEIAPPGLPANRGLRLSIARFALFAAEPASMRDFGER
jgi:hypothetical protein